MAYREIATRGPNLLRMQSLPWGNLERGPAGFKNAIEAVLAMETSDIRGSLYAKIIQPFFDISSGRNLLITEAERLGIGPKGAKARDILFALAGGDVSFIVHPAAVANHYRLVGEAYIDGLMEGESC
jgi:hypothetical protein